MEDKFAAVDHDFLPWNESQAGCGASYFYTEIRPSWQGLYLLMRTQTKAREDFFTLSRASSRGRKLGTRNSDSATRNRTASLATDLRSAQFEGEPQEIQTKRVQGVEYGLHRSL